MGDDGYKDIFNEVAASGKYGDICPETVMDMCRQEHPRHKKQKDAVKAVKARLHQASASFISHKSAKTAEETVNQWPKDEAAMRGEAEAILMSHISTAERFSFSRELYDYLSLSATETVLDAACGLNPFYLAYLGIKPAKYDCADIHMPCVALAQTCLRALGVENRCEVRDIRITTPDDMYDTVLLFKVLPLLELQEKGGAARVLRALNAGRIVVSFPTATMSGRKIGMAANYTRQIESYARDSFEISGQREFSNELVFILRRL